MSSVLGPQGPSKGWLTAMRTRGKWGNLSEMRAARPWDGGNYVLDRAPCQGCGTGCGTAPTAPARTSPQMAKRTPKSINVDSVALRPAERQSQQGPPVEASSERRAG